MHRPEGQADRDDLDLHLLQKAGHLGSALSIGPQSCGQQDRVRIQPGSVGPFECAGTAHRAQDGNAQFGQSPGDEPFLACTHRGCRPSHDGTLGGHEQQVGDEHQVGCRSFRRFDIMNEDARVAIGLGQGIVLLACPASVHDVEHLGAVRVRVSHQFDARAVKEHRPQGRPLGRHPAGAPQAPDLLAQGGPAR